MTRYEVEQRIHERVQHALNADAELWRLWAEYFAAQGGSACTLAVTVSMPMLGRCSQTPASDEAFLRGLQIEPLEATAAGSRQPAVGEPIGVVRYFEQLEDQRRRANRAIAAMHRRRRRWWAMAMGCLCSALAMLWWGILK